MARANRKQSHSVMALVLFERSLHGLLRAKHMCGRRERELTGQGSEERGAGAGGVILVIGSVVAVAVVVVAWWWW